MSVPTWMTEPTAALKEVGTRACLPIDALLELRRLTVTCLSSLAHSVREDNYNAANTNDTETTVRGRPNRSDGKSTSADTASAKRNVGAMDAGAGKSNRRGARR